MNLVGQDDVIRLQHIPSHLTHRLGIANPPLMKDARAPARASRSMKESSFDAGGLSNLAEGPGDLNLTARGLAVIQAEREKNAVTQAMARHRGNVSRAAQSLGISRQLLHYKLKKYQIQRRAFI